ncbi:MAG: hypothetical protein ACLQLH_11650 [Terracidiphilus sp.]|jgi:hypothetical protein
MNEPLHPSTLGEILDRTVHLYRSRFLVLLGIAFIPTGVVMAMVVVYFLLFAMVGSGAASTSPEVIGIAALVVFGTLLLAIPLLIAVAALGSAALNHAVAHPWQDEKITVREAYRIARQRGWNYIGLFLLEALIVWVGPVFIWVVLVLLSAGVAALAQSAGMGAAPAGALFALGTIAVVIALAGYCIWMLLRLSLAFPACVVEQIGAITALKRSISLSRGTKGRIFLLYLLGTVLNYLLTMAFTIPAIIVIALAPGAGNPKYAQTAGMVMMLVIYGAAFVIQALTKPVYGIALMLFYYDQRIRQEGFDIELLMQRAGLVTPPPPPPPAERWPPTILTSAQAVAAVMPDPAIFQQPAEPIQTKSEEFL